MKTLLTVLSTLLLAIGSAHAIDPGTAQGWLQIDGGEVSQLTHAYVYRERPQEMLILIADRAVPDNVLPRLTFSSIDKMALSGNLRGLFIRVDPAQLRNAVITPLGTTVAKVKRGNLRSLWIENNRVRGNIESYPADIFEFAYAVQFNAPLFVSQGTVPGGSVRQ